MATGDKKTVVMQADRAIPNGVATLDESGVLDSLQWPDIDNFGAADRILSNLTDPAQALSNLGAPAFISTFAQLGFTEATATDMIALVSAMPTRSIALLQCNTEAANNGLVPGSYGALLIHRQGLNVMCEFGRIGATVRHFGFVNLNQQNWSGWKQYATTDYAVNKAGDTMTGPLKITLSSSPGEMNMQPYNNVAYIESYVSGDYATRRKLALASAAAESNLTNALALMDTTEGVSTRYNIFHAGNKPSGTYTGNGDATARTIETGGIGNVVAIYAAGGLTILSSTPGLAVRSDGIAVIPYAEGHMTNGIITLATTHLSLNASGATYNYQVL